MPARLDRHDPPPGKCRTESPWHAGTTRPARTPPGKCRTESPWHAGTTRPARNAQPRPGATRHEDPRQGRAPVAQKPSGMELASITWGNPDGPRFLGLHGWLDNAATFSRVAPLLPELHLVSLDLPGHGQSPHRERYYFTDWVADVIREADRRGWEQFGLIAHSMGAGVSPLVAGTFPERITQLILLEGLGPMFAKAEEAPAQLKRALTFRPKPAGVYKSYDEALERLAAPRGNLSPESARLLGERAIKPAEGGYTFTHDPELRGPSRMRLTEPEVEAFFERITCPTLVVEAENGMQFDPEITRRRLGAIKGPVTLARLPGGHHFHLEQPEPLSATIREFLKRYSPE